LKEVFGEHSEEEERPLKRAKNSTTTIQEVVVGTHQLPPTNE